MHKIRFWIKEDRWLTQYEIDRINSLEVEMSCVPNVGDIVDLKTFGVKCVADGIDLPEVWRTVKKRHFCNGYIELDLNRH